MTAYIVNGIGRCGTTLMYHYLMKKYKNNGFIKDLNELNKLNFKLNFNSNVVYKTHSLNVLVPKPNVKVLFMFGNIYNTVLSYKKRAWSKNAMKHLSVEENFNKNYLETNIFEFNRYFKTWYKSLGYPVMFVRYETLQNNLKEVLQFCGVTNRIDDFPKIIKRQTDWTQQPVPVQKKLIKLYGKDQEFVDKIPDIKIFI